MDAGVKLLDLAHRSADLFESAGSADKRKLLRLALSNCTMTAEGITYEYADPSVSLRNPSRCRAKKKPPEFPPTVILRDGWPYRRTFEPP